MIPAQIEAYLGKLLSGHVYEKLYLETRDLLFLHLHELIVPEAVVPILAKKANEGRKESSSAVGCCFLAQ